MRTRLPRLFMVALAGVIWLLSTSTASAYYYYVHYSGRSAPFTPILEKFDLNSLASKTVSFLVSDQSPVLGPGDSYLGVVSEIRSAAKIWNDVASSDLRLAYGGLFSAGTTESTPGITVEFSDDIPPGLLALSGPEVRGAATQGTSPFVPILHSRILLKRDLTQWLTTGPLASSSEFFFTTLVHEFGHALGLQHTLTSSAMSTALTSASTKASPLASDDIAGISLLYPAPGYLATVGSLSGRVTLNGSGVNLASVVAISASNAAISSLTNPDGTFRIDGVPPGQYFIYTNSLPAASLGEPYPANITPQVDTRNVSFAAGPNFTTQFFPGTRDWTQAFPIFVYAGNTTTSVNFNVAQRSSNTVSSVRTYGFLGAVAISSPPLNVGVPTFVLASGTTGLLQQNGSLTPGLTINTIGTPAQIYDLQPYQQYALFAVQVNNTTGPGPKHLLFSTPGDLYVLPSGFNVTITGPPSITSATAISDANGNRVVAISGTNLSMDTRIVFDGLPATVTGFGADGRLLVIPPQAPGSYTAPVVALNPDGQSSLFLQGTAPTTYTFDPTPAPALAVAPAFLTPSVDTLVDIVGSNVVFDSQTVVGFGNGDVAVKKLQVLSPTHIVVTATAPAGQFISVSNLNVTSGLRILSQAFGVSVTPQQPQPQQPLGR